MGDIQQSSVVMKFEYREKRILIRILTNLVRPFSFRIQGAERMTLLLKNVIQVGRVQSTF